MRITGHIDYGPKSISVEGNLRSPYGENPRGEERSNRSHWTKEEEAILREHWHSATAYAISRVLPGRGRCSIIAKARRMKLGAKA